MHMKRRHTVVVVFATIVIGTCLNGNMASSSKEDTVTAKTLSSSVEIASIANSNKVDRKGSTTTTATGGALGTHTSSNAKVSNRNRGRDDAMPTSTIITKSINDVTTARTATTTAYYYGYDTTPGPGNSAGSDGLTPTTNRNSTTAAMIKKTPTPTEILLLFAFITLLAVLAVLIVVKAIRRAYADDKRHYPNCIKRIKETCGLRKRKIKSKKRYVSLSFGQSI